MKFWKYVKDIIQDASKKEQSSQSEEQSQEQDSQDDTQEQQQSSQKMSDSQQSEQQTSDSSQEQDSQTDTQEQQQSSQEMSDSQQSEQQSSDSSQEQDSQTDTQEQQQSSQEMSDSQQSEQQSSDSSQEQDSQTDTQEQQQSSQEMNDSQQSEQQTSDSSQEQDSQTDTQEQQQTSQEMSDSQQSEQQTNDSSQKQDSQTDTEEQQIPDDKDSQFLSEKEINDEIDKLSDMQDKSEQLSLEQKKELLQKLRDKLRQIADEKEKAQKLGKEHLIQEQQEVSESKEEKYELSEQTNNFLNQLGELPSFEDRNRGPGYSIDTESYTEVPESIIRTLITRFLNQRFCKHNTDLNVRSNSLEKTSGFYKWEVKDVIVHLETHQVTKVLTDKYGYEYSNGKNENVPLSFYFDMSGSMSKYTNMLAVIAIELLKKGVKVLIGFNERVNVQIESIEKNISVSELAEILESAGYCNGWGNTGRNGYKKDPRVKFKYIERNIDNYLIEKKAEKCVVFSDFDPRSEVINLSQAADVYWFCFESSYYSYDINGFNGFIYKVQNIKDLEQGLLKVNEKRFETLCYTDNPAELQKKVRVKK